MTKLGRVSTLRGPVLRRILAVVILVFMAAGLLRVVGGDLPTGHRVDPFTVVLDNGRRHEIDGQTTVLTFWASWCGPCKQEAPILNALSARGVAVVGVSMDPDPMDVLRDKARQIGVRYPIVAERHDLARDFSVRAVPTTFVIAPDRTVVFAQSGVASGDALRAAIAEASAGQPE